MKSERRHELQHNDLADWIVSTYERVVPYKTAILGVVVLLVVFSIVISVWHSHSVAQAGEAWNSLGIPVFQPVYADERTISLMQKASQSYSGMPAGEWADVFAGDTALMIGTNRLLTDKKVGIDYLTQARDLYTNALKTVTIPGAKEQAMFGKARALESLIQNKEQLDEAIAAYKALSDSFPRGMFKALADRQIEQLGKKDTLLFYESLAQYTPKPKARSPQSQLGNLGSLPDEPPLIPETPVRGGGSAPAPVPSVPVPSLTPTEPAKATSQKTEAPKAEPAKSSATKSDGAKPDAAKPDASKPEAAKSDASKSEPAKSQATNPAPVKTEVPKPEAPKKDK